MKNQTYKSFLMLVLGLLININTVYSQENYSKVRVSLNHKSIRDLSNIGIPTDHGVYKENSFFEVELNSRDIVLLRENGFDYTILIENVSQYYLEHAKDQAKLNADNCSNSNQTTFADPVDFNLGSMSGYFTYQEMLDKLDSMAVHFPNIISVKKVINDTILSIEGRPIYYVVISDNPDSIEAEEPTMLFTALHHAREPGSLSQLLYFMQYLGENYSSNLQLQEIINTTALYFVPCVNPDGYIYNQTTNPNGGGMWRKNRRVNGDGTFGVDLNRNYAYFWGFDNIGSSNQTASDTYRGTIGFSEPETRAIRFLCKNANFKMAINNHTYGNLLIYPWGYLPSIYTPDSAQFVNMAQYMTAHNHYTFGTGDQTVGYVTNGDSDDYLYGEQTEKPKILSMTPEAGEASLGFWPPQSEILPFCREMLTMNLRSLEALTNLATIENKSNTIVQNLNDWAKFSFTKIGLSANGIYQVSVSPLSSNIINATDIRTYSNPQNCLAIIDSIPLQFSSSIAYGDTIKYALVVNYDNAVYSDTVIRYFGNPSFPIFDQGNNLNNWTSTTWNTTGQSFYSASQSITDSPDGNYPNNTTRTISTINGIPLLPNYVAQLSFYAKWNIENNYDFVQLSASIDSGLTWTPLCGRYTNLGSNDQLLDQPLYDGMQMDWVNEKISLNDYLGQRIWFQILLNSDGGVTADGFYFDDFAVIQMADSLTGTKESKTTSKISIQPNPGNEYVYLSGISTIQNTEVSIIDVMGKVVSVQNLIGNNKLLVNNLANGTYYIRCSSKGSLVGLEKLVVMH